MKEHFNCKNKAIMYPRKGHCELDEVYFNSVSVCVALGLSCHIKMPVSTPPPLVGTSYLGNAMYCCFLVTISFTSEKAIVETNPQFYVTCSTTKLEMAK